MAAWTLMEAQEHLAAWLAADLAVAKNQEYEIEGRRFTRANAREIQERIAFWRREVDRLTAGRTAGPRVIRVVPRDL